MNKKGMTLIELLVYMAIAALLLAPVIMLMQNSSLNMARDAVNTDLRISGRDILNIMYDDIRNTGFKLENAAGTVNDSATFIAKKFTGTSGTIGDSSSFLPTNGTGAFDALIIRKGRLDKTNGSWEGYDTVRYHVSGDTLIRTSTEFPAKKTMTQAIAGNVEALQFQYSDSLSKWFDGAPLVSGNKLFVGTSSEKIEKIAVRYIKIAIVTVDKKKLSPTKTFSSIEIGDYTFPEKNDQYLREISEIVVPIPNNGLFPK